MGFPGGTVVKNPPASAGDTGDTGLIPGSERFPGEDGNQVQYCWENPVDRNLVGYSSWGHKELDAIEHT